MRIFAPGEMRNTEYFKLKYSPSTPDISKSCWKISEDGRDLKITLERLSCDELKTKLKEQNYSTFSVGCNLEEEHALYKDVFPGKTEAHLSLTIDVHGSY